MANFSPQTFNIENINNGNKFEIGDAIPPEAVNAPIEAAALLQMLAQSIPIMREYDSRDVRVEIENGAFVFYNLGSAGIRFWSGTSTPSSPKIRDMFLNTNSGELYEYTGMGKWTLVYNFSTGGKLTVDSQLSATSTNPVQNKVVNSKFTEISNSLSNKVEKIYNSSIANKVLGVKPNSDTPVLLDMVGGGSGAGLRIYSENDTYNVGDIVYFPSSPNYYGDLFTPSADSTTGIQPILQGNISSAWIALNPYWDYITTISPTEEDVTDGGTIEIDLGIVNECILQISVTSRGASDEKVGLYTVYLSGKSVVSNSKIISQAGMTASLTNTHQGWGLVVEGVYSKFGVAENATVCIKVLSGSLPDGISVEIYG